METKEKTRDVVSGVLRRTTCGYQNTTKKKKKKRKRKAAKPPSQQAFAADETVG